MRSRLKFPYFITLLLFFLVLIISPLLFNGRMASATNEVNVGYSQDQFIKTLAPEVKPLAEHYGIRPSILIGQILLETDNGRTLLAAKYHNLFSKEADLGQPGIRLKDSLKSGQVVRYAVYKDRESSIRDYLSMLSQGQQIDKRLYRSLATEKGYKAPAQSLQDYRYSEDTTYAKRLIKVIEEKDLTSYD